MNMYDRINSVFFVFPEIFHVLEICGKWISYCPIHAYRVCNRTSEASAKLLLQCINWGNINYMFNSSR